MSRIGKKPITIPEGVEVKIDDNKVDVKGPKGEIQKEFRPEFKIEIKESKILISPKIINKNTNALWGLTRSLIANMVEGVKEGFERKLKIEGLGYRAQIVGDNLELSVGFSHPVRVKMPENVKFSLEEKNVISISGPDLETVSQVAAKIRAIKPPEPYKGKGIRYLNEVIRRKVGKKATTTK